MIEFQQQGRVARLRIRRAAKKNALDEPLWRALGEHALRITAEPAAQRPRVLLLEGEPGVFCAGADIEEMTRTVHDPAALAASNHTITQTQLAIDRLPLPTIALIDGPCFGGGFGLAAACDFRLGTQRASFAITPARLGLIYSIEDTRRVVALVGAARTKRLLMRSERLDAATALTWGVLDELHDGPEALASAAHQWCEQLLQQSGTSLAGTKATLGWIVGHGHDGERGQAQVRALYDAAFTGADFAEGSAAFLQRRPPQF
jgi:enoyl-CoA hydratase